MPSEKQVKSKSILTTVIISLTKMQLRSYDMIRDPFLREKASIKSWSEFVTQVPRCGSLRGFIRLHEAYLDLIRERCVYPTLSGTALREVMIGVDNRLSPQKATHCTGSILSAVLFLPYHSRVVVNFARGTKVSRVRRDDGNRPKRTARII